LNPSAHQKDGGGGEPKEVAKKREKKEAADQPARVHSEAPYSDHAIDWIAIGEKDGVDLDKNGAYVESRNTTRVDEMQAAPGKKQEERDLKAIKLDDSEVPVWLWNDTIRQGLMANPISHGHLVEAVDQAFDVFRGFLLQWKFKLGVTHT
jgi:hypothetical protein